MLLPQGRGLEFREGKDASAPSVSVQRTGLNSAQDDAGSASSASSLTPASCLGSSLLHPQREGSLGGWMGYQYPEGEQGHQEAR